MDDKKLLDKIKDSARDTEVPKELKPEEIRRKLEEEGNGGKQAGRSGRRKVISFGRAGTWAAAAVAVLLIAVVFLVPGLEKRTAEPAKNVAKTVGTPGKREENIDAARTAEGDEILRVENYEELYALVEESEEQVFMMENGDSRTEESTGASTEASMGTGAEMAPGFPAKMDAGAFAENPKAEAVEDYSKTNVQEENVDEADIAKTDGTYIYVLDDKAVLRIVEAKTMRVTATVASGIDGYAESMEMYVDGDTLQVITCNYENTTVQGEVELPSAGEGNTVRSYYSIPVTVTTVTTYDISDRNAPKKTGAYRQDGGYLTSRRNGGYLYLFTSYRPTAGQGAKEKACYVPRAGGEFFSCEDIFLPGRGQRGSYRGKNYLVGASLKDGEASVPQDRMAVVGGAETFYVSESNIYTAFSVWADDEEQTDLVRLGYEDGAFIPGSGARIPGTVNNGFSMDEYEGKLRVAVSLYRQEETVRSNDVGVELKHSNGLYVLDQNLKIIGAIEGLAQNEEIKSARFMGDTGYFVTYRNTDPLFSVDLSDPENPEILGELKVTGFSQYLHFYGEDKLLGLGWETDPDTGTQEGLKCSMFDLGDPGNVKEVDRLVLGDVQSCSALEQYKSILVDPEKNLFGFAYTVNNGYGEERYYYGVFSYSGDKGFQALEYIQAPKELVQNRMEYEGLRGLYIGEMFYLTNSRGIQSYDMSEDFKEKATVLW